MVKIVFHHFKKREIICRFLKLVIFQVKLHTFQTIKMSNLKNQDKATWINIQTKLLEMERLAEVENSTIQVEDISLKTLEAKGVALCQLVVQEQSTGLFGRPILTFAPKPKPGIVVALPSNSFSSGDNVGIWENSGANCNEQITSGVVAKVSSSTIQVALDEESTEVASLLENSLYRLHKLANDVTYRRIKKGLELLEKVVSGPSSHLIEVLFHETQPYEPLPVIPQKLLNTNGELELFNKNLDKSQVDAIEFAMKQKDLAVIHGPPGTGKTTTLVEIILQHVKLGNKVMAAAPSNLAVDNLLERLVEQGAKVVRLGHPARATPKAQLRTLDALVQNSDGFELLKDIRQDIKTSLSDLSRARDKGKRRRIKEDLKLFRKELRQRETNTSKEILSHCSVILTTLTSAGNEGPLKLLSEEHFDLTVIDECSQGLEAACYLSIMRSPKVLIAGDHKQLPPTIMSSEAAKQGLSTSLMERVIESYGSIVTRMLKVQYRMHEGIMNWASQALYEGQLEAHSSVASHLLKDLDKVESNEDTECPMILIDTAGCGFDELAGEDLSKGNKGEAGIVAAHVKGLISAGVNETGIAVISPYNLQVEMIRELLRERHPKVEIRSVDGFQGREKEAIVISLVRSNKQGEIGFLSEDRRLNVAVTRARRHLAVICDTDTVCRHKFIKSLVDHLHAHGTIKSAHEFVDEIELYSNGNSYKEFSAESDVKKESSKKKLNKSKKEELAKLDREMRKAEFEKLILDFINSKSKNLKFPPDLNSFDRMLVHEIAQNYKLDHQSFGEGKERYLVLNKKIDPDITLPTAIVDTSSGAQQDIDSSNVECKIDLTKKLPVSNPDNHNTTSGVEPVRNIAHEEDVTAIKGQRSYPVVKEPSKPNRTKAQKKDDDSSKKQNIEKPPPPVKNLVNATVVVPVCKTCSLCQKEISVRNFDLHSIQCEKLKRDREIKKAIDLRKSEIGGARKKEHNKNSSKKSNEEESEIDDFELMARFEKENKSCAFPRCKNKCIILLQLCNFCRNNFCLTHHQAEIHGCGEEVRKHARTVLIKSVQNGVLTPGSRVPSKKPNPTVRVHLQRKLDKKLDKLSEERKSKKKDNS